MLAYSNPWASPLGWQLCPSRRETVCAALNSAILGKIYFKSKLFVGERERLHFFFCFLESLNYSWRPPMELCIAHACELLRLMACSSLGTCAFASIEDILHSESMH